MKYEIGTEIKDSKVAGFALAQLQKYLATTQIDEQAPDVIELSLDPPSQFPGDFHDGFCLVRSAGKLGVRAAQERGLLNGVYEVLNRIGFAFPFPGGRRSGVLRDIAFTWPSANPIDTRSKSVATRT